MLKNRTTNSARDDFKKQARRLADELRKEGLCDLQHMKALEIMSRVMGFPHDHAAQKALTSDVVEVPFGGHRNVEVLDQALFDDHADYRRLAYRSAELACMVQGVAFNFETQVGLLQMPAGNCCDMRGCINLFERISSDVLLILTFSGSQQDTIYYRWTSDDKWQAIPHTVIPPSLSAKKSIASPAHFGAIARTLAEYLA